MTNAALVGDLHECSVHRTGENRIVSSPVSMICDGRQIATIGAITTCGAVIIEGSEGWVIEGRQVAVLHSKTQHLDTGEIGEIVTASGRIDLGRR